MISPSVAGGIAPIRARPRQPHAVTRLLHCRACGEDRAASASGARRRQPAGQTWDTRAHFYCRRLPDFCRVNAIARPLVTASLLCHTLSNLAAPEPHAGREYRLTGPELLSYAGVAEILTTVLARPITYQSRTFEEDKQAMIAAGLPAPIAEMNAQAFSLLATGDAEWQTTDVSKILGVPSRTFEQFARDHSAAFTPDKSRSPNVNPQQLRRVHKPPAHKSPTRQQHSDCPLSAPSSSQAGKD
jgi:hypothetical protein